MSIDIDSASSGVAAKHEYVSLVVVFGGCAGFASPKQAYKYGESDGYFEFATLVLVMSSSSASAWVELERRHAYGKFGYNATHTHVEGCHDLLLLQSSNTACCDRHHLKDAFAHVQKPKQQHAHCQIFSFRCLDGNICPGLLPAASSSFRSSAAISNLSSRTFSSTTSLNANVLKLTEPAKDLLPDVDVFIFDCDGVIGGGIVLLKEFLKLSKNFVLLERKYVPAEEIFSSSFAAAAYLEQTNFKESGKKVYVVGEVGIQEELDLIGVPHFGGPEDGGKQPDMGPGGALPHDSDVESGCEFIATNTDAVTHLTDAQEWAGNGSMVGAIKGCTGQEQTFNDDAGMEVEEPHADGDEDESQAQV
ncbi:phosphoglycolate phosphatase [Skeletonema marinoi]|uniref:Phosphoglycolate phosphatase n=1 Tax=Skeletonema marinoi TaxID=267567 RepID=A0AAD8Y135_9STRA|nr:phosphoglycolate phosphatase [Skeletonema marinoi]